MLIGLASKNAILIVEYANQLKDQGLNIVRAAIKAGQTRFRPILMTAISSLCGFWPLVVASGAGASSRWSLGTAVFSGLLFATILSLFLVPSLYIIIKSIESRFRNKKDGDDSGDDDKYPNFQYGDRSGQPEITSYHLSTDEK